ncbi:MAG TPA: zinc ABC transporter substrate-binding protein [Erysipelotrichaceae bacterium]|nr:zinc ABC transporter substrate-binding protein [Erysipelotrichaceae bacterium]
MKKSLSVLILFILFFSGCTSSNPSNDKLNVIVTLFPQYDMVRSIAQDKVNVSLLLPAGVEPHAYEPTPSTLIEINQSDLFIYTSDIMETWISHVFQDLTDKGPVVVDSSIGVSLLTHSDEDGEEYDPHFWLDPINTKIMVSNVLKGLIQIDPDNTEFYQTNADEYLSKLDELDDAYVDLFSRVKTNKLIYGGHFAFGYLSSRFNIDILSPYSGYSPDAEPSVSSLSELLDTMNTYEIKVIFYEELIDPKIARIISEQTNATIDVLHGGHNISKEEMDQGITYFDLMYANIEKLKGALNYE